MRKLIASVLATVGIVGAQELLLSHGIAKYTSAGIGYSNDIRYLKAALGMKTYGQNPVVGAELYARTGYSLGRTSKGNFTFGITTYGGITWQQFEVDILFGGSASLEEIEVNGSTLSSSHTALETGVRFKFAPAGTRIGTFFDARYRFTSDSRKVADFTAGVILGF